MSVLGKRDDLARAIRALQDELAGGARAELPVELELLGGLVHTREMRARTKEEPERELLAALFDAAALVGRDGRVRVANRHFEALAPGGRAAGLSPLEITRSADLDEAVRRALEGHARRLEVESPQARRVWLVHVAPLLRGEALVVLRDVTVAKRAEAVRRDFVANASHELRTPVAAIRGAAETLLDGALQDPDAARRFVDMIARHAERLARLTDDLLDLSRIESGQWQMRLERVALAPLTQSVLDLHADRAAQRQLRLVREVPADAAAVADARALEQVLVNLVDNAVKYTPPGGAVTVRAHREPGRVLVEVVDTGPGIERHHLARLFERFYRADAGRSRDQGGTGLGLAIVKHLAQAQNGDVGVESGTDGTRFWVSLPLP
ncbi:MAG TPA: ATP-binding protein [Anaeromyxobacteraceae bacterium]|nr:ATP-binding protein [Anaeromyxobacteraceae bacterium]